MNQALQFLEDEFFDTKRKAVIFSALQSGFKLTCAISEMEIGQRYGAGLPLNLFRDHRWDIEEDAERVIHAQQDDKHGYYWVCSK